MSIWRTCVTLKSLPWPLCVTATLTWLYYLDLVCMTLILLPWPLQWPWYHYLDLCISLTIITTLTLYVWPWQSLLPWSYVHDLHITTLTLFLWPWHHYIDLRYVTVTLIWLPWPLCVWHIITKLLGVLRIVFHFKYEINLAFDIKHPFLIQNMTKFIWNGKPLTQVKTHRFQF